METNNSNEYRTFSPVHPFEIVEDEILARGLTKKEFAQTLGMKPSNLSRMLKARGELTSDMALKLESALGIPFAHWMKYYEAYLKDCIRLETAEADCKPKKTVEMPCDDNQLDDFYTKLSIALRPIRERMESINQMLSISRNVSGDILTKEQINSIEADIHKLGKALCEVRLS